MFLYESADRTQRASRDTPIQVTQEDLKRLRALVERHLESADAAAAELLDQELDRARIVTQTEVSPNVVTMRSQVCFEDVDTGARREAVLVYPEEAELTRSMISVLTPVGMALLGLAAGDAISWPMPGNRVKTLRVVSVLYQPEAAGDFTR